MKENTHISYHCYKVPKTMLSSLLLEATAYVFTVCIVLQFSIVEFSFLSLFILKVHTASDQLELVQSYKQVTFTFPLWHLDFGNFFDFLIQIPFCSVRDNISSYIFTLESVKRSFTKLLIFLKVLN